MRPRQVPGKLCAHEPDHLLEFRCAQEIGLGQQYSNLRSVPAKALQKFDVALGKGLVDAHGHQREAHIRQPVQGGLRVVREGALQTGRVHKPQAPEAP